MRSAIILCAALTFLLAGIGVWQHAYAPGLAITFLLAALPLTMMRQGHMRPATVLAVASLVTAGGLVGLHLFNQTAVGRGINVPVGSAIHRAFSE